MKLYEIAVSSYLFCQVSEYDKTYQSFRETVGAKLRLSHKENVYALLDWLNDWGCRQFMRAPKQRIRAVKSIQLWYENYYKKLPPHRTTIEKMTDKQITNAVEAYADLSERIASKRKNGIKVRIGDTGASKILFALRPAALPPWDKPIREKISNNSSKASYGEFIYDIRNAVDALSKECKFHKFKLEMLPQKLKRKNTTVLKLIDEYYYIKHTQKCKFPNTKMLEQWIEWREH